jgi:hypothetical protein
MAGRAARTAKSKYFLYADDGGERERGRRYWQTGGEKERLRFPRPSDLDHVIRHRWVDVGVCK